MQSKPFNALWYIMFFCLGALFLYRGYIKVEADGRTLNYLEPVLGLTILVLSTFKLYKILKKD